jgi:hypothetical protein
MPYVQTSLGPFAPTSGKAVEVMDPKAYHIIMSGIELCSNMTILHEPQTGYLQAPPVVTKTWTFVQDLSEFYPNTVQSNVCEH